MDAEEGDKERMNGKKRFAMMVKKQTMMHADAKSLRVSFPKKMIALILGLTILFGVAPLSFDGILSLLTSGSAASTTKRVKKEIPENLRSVFSDMEIPEREPGPVFAAIDEWYEMTPYGTQYYAICGISEGLRAAIESGTVYTDSAGNCWIPGEPLPNPGTTYKDRPIIGGAKVFQDLDTSLKIDLTAWDFSSWTYFLSLFEHSTIAEVDLSGCRMPYVYNSNILFDSCEIGKVDLRGLSLPWNSDTDDRIGLFMGSTIGYLDVRGMEVRKLDSLFAQSRIGALNAAKLDANMALSAKNLFREAEIHSMDISDWDVINVSDMTNIAKGARIGDSYQDVEEDANSCSLTELKTYWANPEWDAFEHLSEPYLDLSTWNVREQAYIKSNFSTTNEVKVILPESK